MSTITNTIKNAITAHPKLVTLGISLAITFGVTLALGFVSMGQAFAPTGGCSTCRNLN